MAETQEKPNLYSWYNKNYDYDQFKRDADEGVQEYIASLKRGSKDAEQFMKAYSDIMEGIKDGTIIFKDGRYVDSKGRYSSGSYYDAEGNKQTSKKSSKDYYGLMANYIFGKQRRQKEYVAPEDKTKIKWNGSSSIGQAITRNIFNSDTWNNQDFMDLATFNEDGTVSKDPRYDKLMEAYQYVHDNFDNLFTGYTDTDKNSSLGYINDAIKSLKDKKVDHDYLTLRKASGNLDYRSMFADKTVKQPEEESEEEPQQQSETQRFIEWVTKKYPKYTGTLASRNLTDSTPYGSDTLNRITKAINNLDSKNLLRIIYQSLVGNGYTFNDESVLNDIFGENDYKFSNQFGTNLALKALQKQGRLKSFGGENAHLYYIPITTKDNRQIGYVWNSNDNTISEMSYHDIPYWRQKIWQEWQNYNNTNTDTDPNNYYIQRYFTQQHKKGGILKASGGMSFPGEENTQLPWYAKLSDFDPSKYISTYDTDNLVNGYLLDEDDSPWESKGSGNNEGMYQATKLDNINIDNLEKNSYYKQFGKDLLDDKGNFTNLGKAWAQAVDKLLPKNSPASFYDENGNPRTSWRAKGKNNKGKQAQSFTKLKDYVNYIRTDGILGPRHNVFLKKGTRYYYTDSDGKTHWVDPNVVDDYLVSKDPTRTKYENGIEWSDYEITDPKAVSKKPETEEPEKDKSKTYINPTKQPQKNKSPYSFGDFIKQISPDLIGAGRLLASLRTNNKISDVVRKSIKPVLKDTYELYSPVTGAFSEMGLRNNQAADIRRQAARPFTSDASLQLAGSLQANSQATNLEHQGFLADDNEIKRTKAEALKRQEDNAARRSEVANFNRASINQTNRELAQLEATRLKQNWQSADNFLSGFEGRLRQRIEEDRKRKQAFYMDASQDDIDNQYYDAVYKAQEKAAEWKEKPENTNKSLSEMPNYLEYLRKLQQWKNAQYRKISRDIYGYKYNNENIDKTIQEIGEEYGFYKKGGSLRPSTLYMINRIIRNENNT